MTVVTKLPAPSQIFVDTLGRLTVDARKFLSELYNKAGGSSPTSAFKVPVGGVFMWAGLTAPSGFLLCNGAAVSRATYADLFAAIGTDYGIGDGSTTFNLPDLRNRVALGASTTYSRGVAYGSETGTIAQTNLPNVNFTVTETPHTHIINVTDAGHTHTFTGTAHNHTITDAGHTHTFTGTAHNHTSPAHGHTSPAHNHTSPAHGHTSPAHNHTSPAHSHNAAAGSFVQSAAGTEYVNTAGNKGTLSAATATAAVTINTTAVTINTTAATIDNAAATGTNANNTTGITVNNQTATGTNASSTAGITAAATSVSTGITVASGGSATPVSLLQPSLAINYIIRAL